MRCAQCKIMSDDPSHQLSSISAQFWHTQARMYIHTHTEHSHTHNNLSTIHTHNDILQCRNSILHNCSAGGQRNITHHIYSRCIDYNTHTTYVALYTMLKYCKYVLSIVESHRQTYIRIVSDFFQSKSKRCHVIKQSKHLRVFLSTHTQHSLPHS